MPVADIELYEALKEKVREKEAKTLLEFIESKVEKRIEDKKEVLATKEDIKNSEIATREEIKRVKVSTKEEIKNLEVRMMDEIKKLEVRIEKTKSDIIKWMFLFWLGQLASLIAILQIFFRK